MPVAAEPATSSGETASKEAALASPKAPAVKTVLKETSSNLTQPAPTGKTGSKEAVPGSPKAPAGKAAPKSQTKPSPKPSPSPRRRSQLEVVVIGDTDDEAEVEESGFEARRRKKIEDQRVSRSVRCCT
jgi:hypothetical protein